MEFSSHRLATEADVKPDTKTCKRTEDAAADQVKNGDSSSARVDDGPTCSTSFSMIAEPLAPEKSIGDAVVNNGAESPKPHLAPIMHVCVLSSAPGGLLLTSTASPGARTIFSPQSPSWTLGDKTKKRTSRTNFNHSLSVPVGGGL